LTKAIQNSLLPKRYFKTVQNKHTDCSGECKCLPEKIQASERQCITSCKSLMEACEVHAITNQVLNKALTIMERYGYSIFDSMIIASALDAGCLILYSEDMQHEQRIESKLSIINPFRTLGT